MASYVPIMDLLVYSFGKHEAVLVLKAFLDESGHSGPGGTRFVCMGGGIAQGEAWTALEVEWAKAMEDGRQSLELTKPLVFHMTEFEANDKDFKKWKDKPDEHKAFLARLIGILDKYVEVYLGSSEPVYRKSDGSLAVDEPYYNALIGILDSAAAHIGKLDLPEKIEMVFADHPEYGRMLRKIYPEVRDAGGMNYNRLVGDSYFFPKDVLPLQVADLIAFEMRKERERMQFRQNDKERWSFLQLRKKPIYWNGYFTPPDKPLKRQNQ